MRRKFGIVLQNPDDMLFNATVMEDMEFGPAQIGMDREEFLKILEELDEVFSLSPLLSKPPFKLSEGEKQRVAMACASMVKYWFITRSHIIFNCRFNTAFNNISSLTN